MKPLNEQVVIITGGSSGIGRAAAIQFGQAGATVILAARGADALRAAAHEVEATGGGGEVFTFILDVADATQVQALADFAVAQAGRIDTWINDASVSIYGTFDTFAVEEYTRVVEVNLLGVMHGVRAVLPFMKRQGEGTIINVGSGLSIRSVPIQSAYVAAKHGVKGFTDAVRLELQYEGYPNINMTLVMPGSVNTPFFRHARTTMGVKAAPLPPAYTPELVAETIVHAATVPTRDVYAGGVSFGIALLERISPALADRMLMAGNLAVKGQQSDQPPPLQDNLFAPVPGPGSVHGEFDAVTKPSLWTRLFELQPRAVLPALGLVAGVLAISRLRREG